MTKYHDNMMKELERVFKEADKAFKSMEEKMSKLSAEQESWQSHRLVLPKKIGKRWYMPGRLVYRKLVWHESHGGQYQYGTEFDVLKDGK